MSTKIPSFICINISFLVVGCSLSNIGSLDKIRKGTKLVNADISLGDLIKSIPEASNATSAWMGSEFSFPNQATVLAEYAKKIAEFVSPSQDGRLVLILFEGAKWSCFKF